LDKTEREGQKWKGNGQRTIPTSSVSVLVYFLGNQTPFTEGGRRIQKNISQKQRPKNRSVDMLVKAHNRMTVFDIDLIFRFPTMTTDELRWTRQ